MGPLGGPLSGPLLAPRHQQPPQVGLELEVERPHQIGAQDPIFAGQDAGVAEHHREVLLMAGAEGELAHLGALEVDGALGAAEAGGAVDDADLQALGGGAGEGGQGGWRDRTRA
jgi:hypothetical protein